MVVLRVKSSWLSIHPGQRAVLEPDILFEFHGQGHAGLDFSGGFAVVRLAHVRHVGCQLMAMSC